MRSWNVLRLRTAQGVSLKLCYAGQYEISASDRSSHVVFWEDRERYNDCTKVAQFMVHMDQQGVFLQVTGLILGHYFTDQFSADMGKYQILVVLCDDFWP